VVVDRQDNRLVRPAVADILEVGEVGMMVELEEGVDRRVRLLEGVEALASSHQLAAVVAVGIELQRMRLISASSLLSRI
jgi:hypothetical protein